MNTLSNISIFFEPLQSGVSDHGSNLASARIPSPSHSTEWIPSPPVHCLSSSLEGLQPSSIVSFLSCILWFGRGCNHGILSLRCSSSRGVQDWAGWLQPWCIVSEGTARWVQLTRKVATMFSFFSFVCSSHRDAGC